jgi:hypothetical protein
MAVFRFRVNQSFLRYSHPITIPERLQSDLKESRLDGRDYRIVYPKGESLAATMYCGTTGGHKYYQLKVPSQDRVRPDYLRIDDILMVVLVRFHGVSYALLEYMQKPGTWMKSRQSVSTTTV